ncbi:MAG: outer membrane lipid asymmetry maintenance protein MlaD [Candidatus Kinetoplastibacterium crithidii]|nr:outer membrane lipid asymmetry maintenance protein MlaD [Candidatus Kinetoplastibacterium crithidii]
MYTKKYKIEAWVGLFVIIGVISFVFLALYASNMRSASFSSVYTITTHFEDIGGLKTNAPVKSAGVKVGRVKKVHFNNKTLLADVVIEIDKKIPFPIDTTASILTSGILGEQFIGLTPGAEEAILEDKGVIVNTQSALSIEHLVGKLLYFLVEKDDLTKSNSIFTNQY